jgi:hypothetical protein
MLIIDDVKVFSKLGKCSSPATWMAASCLEAMPRSASWDLSELASVLQCGSFLPAEETAPSERHEWEFPPSRPRSA